MSETETLPPFPVDDVTLAAVEHAFGAAITFDTDEWGEPDLDNPRLIGADYSLHTLLDFMSGTTSDDHPLVEVKERDWDGTPRVIVDERPHYTERDIIRALIAEVRRLRGE